MDNQTPMLRQYLEIKKQYPGTLLFFRLGDFYELFNEDAVTGARELDITLTARQKGSARPIPMCGVPHHAAANYIARLVRKGYRVAICEQAEAAGKEKKLVRREVVRVITPGTAVDPQLLDSTENVFLAAVCGAGETFGAAFLDVSTGEFLCTEFSGATGWAKICSEIESFAPREILFPESLSQLVEKAFPESARHRNDDLPSNVVSITPPATGSARLTLTPLDDWLFNHDDCRRFLHEHFGVRDLNGFGLQDKIEAVRSAGACLRYARETQRALAAHISEINFLQTNEFLMLDPVTLKNLEIVEPLGGDSSQTLYVVINHTITGMGARLLRSWLLRPSFKRAEIETRQSAVGELCGAVLLKGICALLKDVSDLERLAGRLSLNTITPRELIVLNRSLSQTPLINLALSDANSLLLQVLSENIFELPETREFINRSVSENPPLSFSDGGVIREGYSQELDELRRISRDSKQIIASFEESERRRTGINNLRVKFNNVFGYCIEISRGSVSRVPDDYERRQTLSTAERYTTPQLKEWEAKVLNAEERIKDLETSLFTEIKLVVAAKIKEMQSTARALATLDALQSLAKAAVLREYVRPQLHDADEIKIEGGRHPIVESFTQNPFVPNDILANNSADRLLIITGPNMGGKSTILRQVALIQILAQIGSYVPARSARLPVLDRIWTRVGAADDLAGGRSTFMVEMTETALILHNATPRSLIILDEIGRGTSTFDGLAIAWAVAEYLHNSPEHSAKTLFATHYHELTELAEKLPGAKNYQITAAEKNGEVVFLHKLQPGKASKSYGIAVAKLAGLPAQVIERAGDVLGKLEKYELAVFNEPAPGTLKNDPLDAAARRASRARAAAQTSLFAIANESIIDELRAADPDTLSPEEAKNLLLELCRRIV